MVPSLFLEFCKYFRFAVVAWSQCDHATFLGNSCYLALSDTNYSFPEQTTPFAPTKSTLCTYLCIVIQVVGEISESFEFPNFL